MWATGVDGTTGVTFGRAAGRGSDSTVVFDSALATSTDGGASMVVVALPDSDANRDDVMSERDRRLIGADGMSSRR